MIANSRRSVALGLSLGVLLAFRVSMPVAAEAPAAAAAAAPTTAEAIPFRPLFWDPEVRPAKPIGEVQSIRFLVTGDHPPFSFLDASGRLIGYHVDLARVLCEEIGATCAIQMRPFGELVPALVDKRGDAIMAGLAVGTELRDRLDTTDAYLTTPGRFVALKDETVIPTPEGLEGRWISVVSGSVHEAYALTRFPKARIAAYPDETAAREAVRERRVVAHFGDAIGLSFWLDGASAKGCCAFVGGSWNEPAVFGEGFRIAVAKTNPRLKRHLDWALRKAATDGRLAELYLRWFPRGYY